MVWEITTQGKDEDQTARYLARADVVTALAAMGTGDADAATWHWWTAAALDPAEADLDRLPDRGRLGEVLLTNLRWEMEEVALGSRVPSGDRAPFTPPRVERRSPVFHERGLGRSAESGRVMVRVLVDLQGRPRVPEVLYAGGGPVMVRAALSALRHWSFEPARLGSQPVLFLSIVAVDFDGDG